MSFSRTPVVRSVVIALCLAASVLVAAPVHAHDESEFEIIYAPFECGSEWVAPFGPHHSHEWNLDFNRTDLNYGENRQHDLGQPLFAQGAGTVVRIASHVNAGTYVEIDYGDYTVVYVHLVHGSVADGLVVGDTVTTGQFFAEIGDTGNATGFAHLHIEYFDSRGFDDTTSWQLKQNGQPQTEVTFAGVPVEYGEPIVSSNCVGAAAGQPDPDDGELGQLTNVNTRRDHIVERLQVRTEALDGSTDAASYLHETEHGTHVIGRIPGADPEAGTILVSTSYTSVFDCAPAEAETSVECPGATEHAASTLLALDLADGLDELWGPDLVFVFWDEHDDLGSAAVDWLADEANVVDDDVITIVDLGVQGSNPVLPLRRTTLASTFGNDWPFPQYLPGYALSRPEMHEFATDAFQRPTATALSALGVPTLSLSDLPGSCIGTVDDTPSAVDTDKLAAQTADADDFFRDLIATAPPESAEVDVHADGRLLAAIIERAAYTGETYDALLAALDSDDPITTEVAAAAAQLVDDLAAEPCASHQPTAPFTDVNLGSYARLDIGVIYDLGVTTGTSDTSYSPTHDVTREQMAAFLGRVWRLFRPDDEPTIDMPFGDVDPGSYAYDDIRLLFELEITTGTSPGFYSPADVVTREQMAAFLGRLWLALHPLENLEDFEPHSFGDVDPESYADPYIAVIAALEITTGTSPGFYSPGDFVTREQMAAFLGRFIRSVSFAPDDAEPEG